VHQTSPFRWLEGDQIHVYQMAVSVLHVGQLSLKHLVLFKQLPNFDGLLPELLCEAVNLISKRMGILDQVNSFFCFVFQLFVFFSKLLVGFFEIFHVLFCSLNTINIFASLPIHNSFVITYTVVIQSVPSLFFCELVAVVASG
jgi:hypothetical protein